MKHAEQPCTHCGLPVPESEFEAEADSQFCCHGCRAVFAIIHGHGLGAYYRMRDEPTGMPARTETTDHSAFDDPAFKKLYCREQPGDLLSVTLVLEGLHCAACVWLIEKLATVTAGVREIRIDVGRSLAHVQWDPAVIPLSGVASALEGIGYMPHPRSGGRGEEVARQADRALLIRTAICGAIAGNVMLIAFALYGGQFHGMAAEYEDLFRWVSLLLTLPAMVIGGSVFFRGAAVALRARSLHMDLPISIGILAGFVGGSISTITGKGEVYFESVCALIFLLLVGRLLQQRQQRQAADSTELLHALHPTTARVLDGDRERSVPVEALQAGETLVVRPGERIAADGVIVAGDGECDVSFLTGESVPRAVAAGSEVHAGTSLVAGNIRVRIERVGAGSRLGQLMTLVEECSSRAPRIVGAVDRIAGWFVATVMLLAAVTASVWWQLDPGRALDHVIAMLVVTCPCALGLATPLAVSAAIGRAARAGILIKGGDVIERLARPGLLWLDKTGTVTMGRPELMRWVGDDQSRVLAAALERASSHPIARALVRSEEPPALELSEVTAVPGGGIRGLVEGQEVAIGSPAALEELAGETPETLLAAVDELTAGGATAVCIAVSGVVVAVAGFRDALRPEAKAAVASIQAAGWEVGMISGDDPRVAKRVGRALGIQADRIHGGISPEGKVEIVRRETSVMVGDGINDAAALAAADVGIGVHGGAEASLSAADVALRAESILSLAELLGGSRRTLHVIYRNLATSLVYNVIGASLALAGVIGPLGAAILMPLSSLTVIATSYRARTFQAVASGRSRTLRSSAADPADRGNLPVPGLTTQSAELAGTRA